MLALEIIYKIIFWFTFGVTAYFAFLAIIGIFFHKQKYPMQEDKEKFVIFVPCHNEEAVISATVENLAKIDYDENLYEIYFIADNCQDKTAEKIQETIKNINKSNFHVLERNVSDPHKKGKPHAMRWAIDLLEEDDAFYNKYDMFMVIDADNFVDADILKHINSQYLSYKEKRRPVMIQAYLDSKNNNSLIARGYYVGYRISNGFFNLPKSKLGLQSPIGGTGFAIDLKFLQSIGGYNCKSLTEDLEIQTIATLKGKRVKFNINTRIYDEKPTRLKASMVQKTRWAQGHWWCCFRYFFVLFLSLFNLKQIHLVFKKLDMMLYLLTMLVYLLIIPMLALNIVCLVMHVSFVNPIIAWTAIGISVFTALLVPIASLYDGPKKEKKRVLLDLIPNYIALFITGLVFVYSAVVGLFKCGNQKVWKKTTHKMTTKVGDENSNKKENQTSDVVVDVEPLKEENKVQN